MTHEKNPGAAATAATWAHPTFNGFSNTTPADPAQGLSLAYLNQEALFDALHAMSEETLFHAPTSLSRKLDAAITPTLAAEAMVHLARVRFESHRFELDTDGRWAIVLPVYVHGTLCDFGAFDVEVQDLRRPYINACAVGFDAALWDAHFHPKRRMLLHDNAWSYLHAECVGCVPISWRQTALGLLANDIRGVFGGDDAQAREVTWRLTSSLRPPDVYVLKTRALA